MTSKIQKWGNSLGIRIPKNIADSIELHENAEVEIEVKDGAILIFPKNKSYTLSSLLSGINKSNLHKMEEDVPVGNEVW
jgi:antitoxin MazE